MTSRTAVNPLPALVYYHQAWPWAVFAFVAFAICPLPTPAQPPIPDPLELPQQHSSEETDPEASRFRGVVCFFNTHANELFVADDNSGFCFRPGLPEGFEPGVGQLIEVSLRPEQARKKITEPVWIKLLGEGPLPSPVPATYPELLSGQVNNRYCEIKAVVRRLNGIRPDRLLGIILVADGGRFEAAVDGFDILDCRKLIDAEVRLCGVARAEGTASQDRSITLFVSGMSSFEVVSAPSTDPEWSLGEPMLSHPVHRIGTSGIIWFEKRGLGCFYLVNTAGVVEIRPSQTTVALSTGDRVEVLGFPRKGERHVWILEDAEIRKISAGTPRRSPRVALQDVHPCWVKSHRLSGCAPTGQLRLESAQRATEAYVLSGFHQEIWSKHIGRLVDVRGVALTNGATTQLWVQSAADIRLHSNGRWKVLGGAAAITGLLFLFRLGCRIARRSAQPTKGI